MTNAWFLGAAQSVPQDESEVRSTVEPVRDDGGETAEAQHAPDFNEFDTDESGDLVGLSPRMVGSDTVDTVRYPPWWSGLATDNHNVIVDNQVATSGTAAAREAAGIQGHGTMQYALGMEPVIREGGAYGNDYFAAAAAGVQDGMGAYMSPVDQDNWASALVAARAEIDSRQAFNSSLYNSLLT